MSGKKFTILFVVFTALAGAGVSLWIKQGYDTRPNIEQQKQQEALQAQPATQGETDPADAQNSTK